MVSCSCICYSLKSNYVLCWFIGNVQSGAKVLIDMWRPITNWILKETFTISYGFKFYLTRGICTFHENVSALRQEKSPITIMKMIVSLFLTFSASNLPITIVTKTFVISVSTLSNYPKWNSGIIIEILSVSLSKSRYLNIGSCPGVSKSRNVSKGKTGTKGKAAGFVPENEKNKKVQDPGYPFRIWNRLIFDSKYMKLALKKWPLNESAHSCSCH